MCKIVPLRPLPLLVMPESSPLKFLIVVLSFTAVVGLLACGDELQQAQPATESSSQGDDGSPGTTAGSVVPGDTEAVGTGSGGGTSAATSDATSDGTDSTPSTSTAALTSTSGDTTGRPPFHCRSDADCAPPTAVCDMATGECVGCLPEGDTCEPGTWCDPELLVCVAGCDDTADCGDQVCDTKVHACVDCLVDRDCAPSVCDVASNACVECLDDGDCPGGVCDTAISVCVGCLDSGDCMEEATPVCDPGAQQCVECVSAADCPTGVCTNNACVTIGFDCLGNSDNCNAGEQCCGAAQCQGDCMISCSTAANCPPMMGCEHGYCLFPCDNDNTDCAAWPGYTCQHTGSWCEAD